VSIHLDHRNKTISRQSLHIDLVETHAMSKI